MSEKMLLTISQAAKVLGVGRQAVVAGVDRGVIRTVTLNRRRLIPRGELDALVSDRVGRNA